MCTEILNIIGWGWDKDKVQEWGHRVNLVLSGDLFHSESNTLFDTKIFRYWIRNHQKNWKVLKLKRHTLVRGGEGGGGDFIQLMLGSIDLTGHWQVNLRMNRLDGMRTQLGSNTPLCSARCTCIKDMHSSLQCNGTNTYTYTNTCTNTNTAGLQHSIMQCTCEVCNGPNTYKK